MPIITITNKLSKRRLLICNLLFFISGYCNKPIFLTNADITDKLIPIESVGEFFSVAILLVATLSSRHFRFFILIYRIIDKQLFVWYIEVDKAFLLQPPAISAVRSLARMPFLFNLNSISTKRIDGVELGGGYGRICARNTPNENGQKD